MTEQPDPRTDTEIAEQVQALNKLKMAMWSAVEAFQKAHFELYPSVRLPEDIHLEHRQFDNGVSVGITLVPGTVATVEF